VYADVHKSYRKWINKAYKNPLVNWLFFENLRVLPPNMATFKNGNAIHALVRSTVQKLTQFKRKHQQSGHHSSGDERLLEIKNSFLSHKGKKVDISNCYVFLILETKNLKFASRSLEPGVDVSTGFRKVGGGVAATGNQKREASEVGLSELNVLAKHLSENLDKLTNFLHLLLLHILTAMVVNRLPT
jgi:hypothetical protein